MSTLQHAYPPMAERLVPPVAEAVTRAGWPLAGWSRQAHGPDTVAYIADGPGPALHRPMVIVTTDHDHETLMIGAWQHADRGGAAVETLRWIPAHAGGTAITLAMYVAEGAQAAAAHMRAVLAERSR